MKAKNITLYVKNEDLPIFERAKHFANGGLSVVIAELLAEWVAKKEAEQPKCQHCGKPCGMQNDFKGSL